MACRVSIFRPAPFKFWTNVHKASHLSMSHLIMLSSRSIPFQMMLAETPYGHLAMKLMIGFQTPGRGLLMDWLPHIIRYVLTLSKIRKNERENRENLISNLALVPRSCQRPRCRPHRPRPWLTWQQRTWLQSLTVSQHFPLIQYIWKLIRSPPSPVVRTNPVTGWKSLFAAGLQVEKGWIDDVTDTESELLKSYCKPSQPHCLFEPRLYRSWRIWSPGYHRKEPRPPSKIQMGQERCRDLG